MRIERREKRGASYCNLGIILFCDACVPNIPLAMKAVPSAQKLSRRVKAAYQYWPDPKGVSNKENL